VVRRAPFSDNPEVGARGQRTQQRILDAALRVFGDEGYHQCSIDRITKLAGCSRASFYQYFSGKEDVFRHLAGQVVRQLSASIEMLAPLSADGEGRATMWGFIDRYTDIYERYEPVFQVFQAAAESDEAVAGGSARVAQRHVVSLRSRVPTLLPPRQLDAVITLLLACVPRTVATTRALGAASPGAYTRSRVTDTLADVVHRTLFGLQVGVNTHPPPQRRPPDLAFSPTMREALSSDDMSPVLNAAGRRTLQALMESGRDVFVTRGYYRTRIDDIVAAAGVSHGAFYRYFESKERFAYVLAVRALRTVSTALAELPDSVRDGTAGRAVLRNWLRRYNATQAAETAMIRVWADAALEDPAISADSTAALDWGRRRIEPFLRPRAFGDPDLEAVVMMSVLSAFGAQEQPAALVDAAAHIVERGFLGQ
jgi:AcrR family transcriptional regulator